MSVSVPAAEPRAACSRSSARSPLAPRFSDIEVERGIVREEILEDLDDDGRDVDADNLARALHLRRRTRSASPSPAASPRSAASTSRCSAPTTPATTPATTRCSASPAGSATPTRRLREIERRFAALPRGARGSRPSPRPPPPQKRARFSFVENTSSQTDLRVAFRALSERDPREPAVEMLMRVLDDGMSTRLYERICDRLGLCYDVSGMYEAYEDDGVLDVAAGAAHERALQVTREIFALLRELAEHGPTEEELAKARDRHLWSIEAMLDDAEARGGLLRPRRARRHRAHPHGAPRRARPGHARGRARGGRGAVFRPERLSVVAVGLLERGRGAEARAPGARVLRRLLTRAVPLRFMVLSTCLSF